MRRYYTPRIPLGNTSLAIPALQLTTSLPSPTISQAGAGQTPGAVVNQRIVNQGGATNDKSRAQGSVSFGQSIYWEPPTSGTPDTYVIQRNLNGAGWFDFASVAHTGAPRYVYTDNATGNIYNATNVQEDGGAPVTMGPTTVAAYRVLASAGGVRGPAAPTKMMFYEGAVLPAWNSATGYLIGDRVSSGGTNYYARTGSINVDPVSNASVWWPMSGGNVCYGPSYALNFGISPFTDANPVTGGTNIRGVSQSGQGGIQLAVDAPLTWVYAGEIGFACLPISDGYFTVDVTPSRTGMALHFAFHTRAPIGDVEPHTNAIDMLQYGPPTVAGQPGTYQIPLKVLQFGISTATASIMNGVMTVTNLSGPGIDAATWVSGPNISTPTYVNNSPPQTGNGNYPVTGQANAASGPVTLYHTSAYKWQIVLADATAGESVDLDNIGVVAPVTAVPRTFQSAYLQGTTTFPMSSTEALNRSRCNDLIMMNSLVGESATDYNNAIDQIHAFDAGCRISSYLLVQAIPQTQTANTIGNVIWPFVNTNNFWAFPNFTNKAVKIDAGGGQYFCNEASPRTVGGLSLSDRYSNAVLIDQGIKNLQGLMYDNNQPTATPSFDMLETGSSIGSNSSTRINAYIAAFQARANYCHSRNLDYVVNGPVGWWIDYCNSDPVNAPQLDYRAAIKGLADVLIYEQVAGNFRLGTATSFNGFLFAPVPGQLGGSRQLQVLRWPDLHAYTSTDTIPEGTPLVMKFGGWIADYAGSNIHTNGMKSLNCLRALMDFSVYMGGRPIWQFTGPPPAQFNNPNGGGIAPWAGADAFVRAMAFLPIIYAGIDTHYVMQQQVPSMLGVMSALDELLINPGTPDTGTAGQIQANVNGGNGQNGAYWRLFHGAQNTSGTSIGDLIYISNPTLTATTITLPASSGTNGDWMAMAPADFGGTAQANVNNGAVVPKGSYAIAAMDGRMLKQRP